MQLTDLEKALGSNDKELDAYLSDVPPKQFREEMAKIISKNSPQMSKVEYASLLIAGHLSATWGDKKHAQKIAEDSVAIAKAVLKEANK